MKKIFLFLLLQIIVTSLHAQIIQGKLLDSKTFEPLPFGSIQNISKNIAVLSDLNGSFKIDAEPQDLIKISYIGYETQTIKAVELQSLQQILLVEKPIEIKGITITSKDNPAYRYIRLIQQNAKRNNPMNLEQFSYTSYNKMKSYPENQERIQKEYQNFFSQSDFFLWETVTERKYKKPNKSNEIVKASKMSGLPGMVIPFSPTNLQDLSFYDNWIKVLGVENLSPIASTALNHYEYEIKDTLFVGQDSIITIEFYPRKNKLGFKGNLKFHTKYYQLISIIANMDIPEDFTFVKDIKIQQLYEQVNDTFWFPYQLNTNILMNIYISSAQNKTDSTQSQSSRLILNVESFLKDINLNTEFRNKDFSNIELEVDESAAQLTDKVLEEHRLQPLTNKEQNTYIKIDSLGSKAKLVSVVRQINKLQQGFIGTKYWDVDLKRLFNYNWIEKSHLGIGLQTNEKISKSFTLGGWLGFGFGDKRWKYGGYTQIYPLKNKEFRLHLNYEFSIRELGSALRYELKNAQWLYQHNTFSWNIRDFYIKNWEYYQHYSASIFFPIVNNLNLEGKAIYEQSQPSFSNDKTNFAEAALRLRYAPLEKLTRYNGKLFIQENKGPLFWAEYRKAIPFLDAQNQYQTWLLGYQHKMNFHKVGILHLWLTASQIFDNHHLSRTMVLRTMGKPAFVSDNHTFNTLPFYIFTAKQQFYLELKHALNNPNFPSKKYSPDLVLIGQGYYAKTNINILPPEYETYFLNNGYAEAGLAIFNLFPEKIAKQISTLRFLGVGFFYRVYGNYDFLKGYTPWSIRIISIF